MINKILNLSRKLIFLDLETTGTDDTSKIVSYSHRVHAPGADKIIIYKTLVNPGMLIPPETTAIHGITDDMVLYGCAKCGEKKEGHEKDHPWSAVPRFADLAANLHRGFTDSDFGGYSVKFDVKILAYEFNHANLPFDFSKAYLVDSYRLWQVKKPRKLKDACQEFLGREHSNAHDAEADITETEEIFEAQHKLWGLPSTVQEIHELTWPKNPNWIDSEGKFVWIGDVPCYNFGQHKGRPMMSKPLYMRDFILKQGFSPEVKNICQEILDGRPPRRG